MPRIRSIKPEFWTSAQVLECSRNARLLFVGLWNFCDDHGRHPDSAKQCKAEVLPADDLTVDDIRGMLDELESNGLIQRYVVDGKGFLQVTGWHHQRIDKQQQAKYPGIDQEDSKNTPGTLPPDRKGSDPIRSDRKGSDHIPPNGGKSDATPSDRCPYEEIINLYHEQLPDLPRYQKRTSTRDKHMRARWREHPGVERFKEFFRRVQEQPFLIGHNERGWMADLEWLMRSENFAKVLEMKYVRRSTRQ